ncbi:MAG: metallophosphoesterase [Planctomycetes bacterium]|nr:metallophosphoesterase [Planctomycetota bacterium]
MTRIAHLSDLHFGAEDPGACAALVRDLERARPAAVVVSGDLTQRARRREFAAARRFLARLPAPTLVVPGNHDVAPVYRPLRRLLGPFDRYQEHIGPDLEPDLLLPGLSLVGIRTPTARHVTSGRVSPARLLDLRRRLDGLPPSTRVLVAHHPFLAPTWGRHHRPLRGLAATLEVVDEAGVDLLLAGHCHVSFVGGTHAYPALRGHTLVVQAGTALSRRLRGEPNAYNLIEVDGDEVRIEVRLRRGERFTEGSHDLYRREDGRWRLTGALGRSWAG